jgi:threonine synthase
MALHYVSTRGSGAAADMGTFQDILLEGLAQDGGLAMPSSIRHVSRDDLAQLANAPYRRRSRSIGD